MLHFGTWQAAWGAITLIIAAGLVVGKLTERLRIPDVAAFLLMGIALGPAALGWLYEPNSSEFNQFLLNFGAALIVYDGGRSVKLFILRQVWITITLLATFGVCITAAVLTFCAHLGFGITWDVAALMAAVVASTDPATLIPVFKRIAILPRLQQTVESESAFNDATASVLVFTVLAVVQNAHSIHVTSVLNNFFSSVAVGALIGVTTGLLALFCVSVSAWGGLREYASIVMLLSCLCSFELAQMGHGSGLMAAFVAGIVTGNGDALKWPLSELAEAHVQHFFNAVTLVLRMMIFILLGTQVDFHVVATYMGAATVLVLILMFVARPMTVFLTAALDRRVKWTLRELIFMVWTRETGVIPASLSGMLFAQHVQGVQFIGSVTFVAILGTVLLQASTTGLVAKKLGLLRPMVDGEV